MPAVSPDLIYSRERVLEACERQIEKSNLSKANKADIFDFEAKCKSEGLSRIRISKYLRTLNILAREYFEKDFQNANRKDVENVLSKLETSPFSPWTKHDYKVCIKKFFKWLRGGDEYPPEVKWIKCTIRNSQHLLPESLLLEEDITKLIQAAGNVRDKAFISLLYESGARIGEILTMRIGQVEFLDAGAALTIHGKTGSRRIRIVSSAPYLSQWIDAHPKKEDKNAPIWVGIDPRNLGKQLRYPFVWKMLKRVAKIAGVGKRMNPHFFRHSRSTYLATKWTDAQMKVYLGWVSDSDMPGTYVHLSGRDLDDAVLGLYGMLKMKEEKSRLEPKKCTRCGLLNESTNERCSQCAAPLTLENAARMLQRLSEDEEKLERQNKFWDWLLCSNSEYARKFREEINADGNGKIVGARSARSKSLES